MRLITIGVHYAGVVEIMVIMLCFSTNSTEHIYPENECIFMWKGSFLCTAKLENVHITNTIHIMLLKTVHHLLQKHNTSPYL